MPTDAEMESDAWEVGRAIEPLMRRGYPELAEQVRLAAAQLQPRPKCRAFLTLPGINARCQLEDDHENVLHETYALGWAIFFRPYNPEL